MACRPRSLVAAWAAIGLLAAAAGCARDPAERAHDRALAYFAEHVSEAEPSWSYLAPYLARRFGVAVELASGQTLTFEALRQSGEPAPTLPAFERLFDPASAIDLPELAALASPVDRITAAALHCDRLPLPMEWGSVLRRASARGGYALTHAALAAQWTVENGCRSWLDLGPLRMKQIEGLVDLLRQHEALADTDPNASDIWIEAIAMLHYLGARDRVPAPVLETLLALQRSDGGWGEHPRSTASSPHTTAFALWVLLEVVQPDATPIAMIPGARLAQ